MAADAVLTPEGHGVRYGPDGEVIGVTIINAKWLLERDGHLTIHVSGDGKHVVGLKIKMPVPCQHGYFLLEISFLSYAEAVTITNGVARQTLEVGADHESKAGGVGMFLQFGANGTLEGRLRVHIPFRSRRVGLCEGTLKFTATKT
jgi:hypothetical protein